MRATRFSLIVFQVQVDCHCVVYVGVLDILNLLRVSNLFLFVFYQISYLFLAFHLKSEYGSDWLIAHPYRLFAS